MTLFMSPDGRREGLEVRLDGLSLITPSLPLHLQQNRRIQRHHNGFSKKSCFIKESRSRRLHRLQGRELASASCWSCRNQRFQIHLRRNLREGFHCWLYQGYREDRRSRDDHSSRWVLNMTNKQTKEDQSHRRCSALPVPFALSNASQVQLQKIRNWLKKPRSTFN